MSRSLLTQSEAAFLLSPTSRTGGDCIRAALLTLISQGRIAIAEKARPFRTFELILGSDNGPDGLVSHQRAVETALREYRNGQRLSPSDVLTALQKKFGYGYVRYIHDHIAPDLIDMGYVVRIDGKWLGLFKRIRYVLSARGMAAIEPLKRVLANLDDLPALVKSNPAQALQLAHSAGVMLVLSPVARRQLPRLRQLMAERVDDTALITISTVASSSDMTGFESHGWNADTSDCSFLDGVSAVCDATSADGGSSDGGSGDSGGGDGGGGGGGGD